MKQIEKATSQTEAIKMILASEMKLSQRDAIEWVGSFRLAARISDIRKLGWIIETKMESFKTRFGYEGEYAVYWLNKSLTPENLWKEFEYKEPSKTKYQFFKEINPQTYLML
jgi:hypothetical protein